jgi:hypothetical protein
MLAVCQKTLGPSTAAFKSHDDTRQPRPTEHFEELEAMALSARDV